MRTTLDLPDDLFRRVKAKAALEGAKLKQLLTRYVENGLREPTQRPLPGRSRLPVIRRRGKETIPNLTARRQKQLEHKDDFAKLRRSFGR